MKTWRIDPVHSYIDFSVRHMLVARARGSFKHWTGTVELADGICDAASVVVYIDSGSIDTRDSERDAHLRSADFLDAQRFPYITFRSSRLQPLDDRHFDLVGNLTIHGITREVTLSVEYGGEVCGLDSETRIGFSARATINRRAFGITFNNVLEAGGLALGEKVEVTVEVQAIEDAAGGAAKSTSECSEIEQATNEVGER